jgi:sec-independent protein translocase protein TatC
MGIFSGLKKETNTNDMSFLGHLSVLRWHLFRSSIVIVTLATIAFFYPEIIFTKILLGPTKPNFFTYTFLCELSNKWNLGDSLCFPAEGFKYKIQSLGLTEQFTLAMWGSFVAGLVVGFPYLLWELWRFVKPALKEKEINSARGFIFYASILFLTGVAFAYYIVCPMAIYFLGNYKLDPDIETNPSLDSYISLTTTLVLLLGLVFELPIVMYFLARFGVVSGSFLAKNRRYAIVIILIVSAVITPTTDIFTQMLVAVPLWILFEMSIVVAKRVEKRMEKETA